MGKRIRVGQEWRSKKECSSTIPEISSNIRVTTATETGNIVYMFPYNKLIDKIEFKIPEHIFLKRFEPAVAEGQVWEYHNRLANERIIIREVYYESREVEAEWLECGDKVTATFEELFELWENVA